MDSSAFRGCYHAAGKTQNHRSHLLFRYLIIIEGKMVCTGAKNEEESRMAARKYARIIQKLGFPAQFHSFKIENIVGSSNVKFPIDLEFISNKHNGYCSVVSS